MVASDYHNTHLFVWDDFFREERKNLLCHCFSFWKIRLRYNMHNHHHRHRDQHHQTRLECACPSNTYIITYLRYEHSPRTTSINQKNHHQSDKSKHFLVDSTVVVKKMNSALEVLPCLSWWWSKNNNAENPCIPFRNMIACLNLNDLIFISSDLTFQSSHHSRRNKTLRKAGPYHGLSTFHHRIIIVVSGDEREELKSNILY